MDERFKALMLREAEGKTVAVIEDLGSEDPVVREFVTRAPLHEPRTEAKEVLRQLVGED